MKKFQKLLPKRLDNLGADGLSSLIDRGIIMLIAYARVSTELQSLNRQLDILKENGAEKIFQEKITGTKRERIELNKMLDCLESGDVVIVAELTRLSRSTKDLLNN